MTPQEHRPIGIFDSGCGGLTIYKAVKETNPAHHFVYLGDHANGPYGDKDENTIYGLTCRGVQHLFEKDCKLVLLACNSASAVALRRLQEDWLPTQHPGKRVLGVLIPVIEEVTQTRWSRNSKPIHSQPERPRATIGVLATPATVSSNAYQREITSRAPQINVVQQPCPGLAEAIERNTAPSDLHETIHHYVQALLDKAGAGPLEGVVLGCTHYPLASDLFRAALPTGTRLIEQDAIVASSLKNYLARHEELASIEASTNTVFLTTGNTSNASSLAGRFLRDPAAFSRIYT